MFKPGPSRRAAHVRPVVRARGAAPIRFVRGRVGRAESESGPQARDGAQDQGGVREGAGRFLRPVRQGVCRAHGSERDRAGEAGAGTNCARRAARQRRRSQQRDVRHRRVYLRAKNLVPPSTERRADAGRPGRTRRAGSVKIRACLLGRLRYLDIAARRAPRGRGGTLLLDPRISAQRTHVGAAARARRRRLADHRAAPARLRRRGRDQPATSVDDYAGDIVDLLDTLHVEDAVVGGLSMGGYVAFALFRHAPRYIRGAGARRYTVAGRHAGGCRGARADAGTRAEKGRPAVADEMLPKLLGESTRRDDPTVVEPVRALILANSTEAIAGAITAMMTRPDSTPLLATIHVPTLVVVGEEDTLTPPPTEREMHKAMRARSSCSSRKPDTCRISSSRRPSTPRSRDS